jgi:hypothetical protein
MGQVQVARLRVGLSYSAAVFRSFKFIWGGIWGFFLALFLRDYNINQHAFG